MKLKRVVFVVFLVALGLSSHICLADGMGFEEFAQRLLANYGKIKDMRATVITYQKDTRNKENPDKFVPTGENKYIYKAPKKMKWVLMGKETLTDVVIGNKEFVRMIDTGELSEEDISGSGFTLLPFDISFYERMVEYIKEKLIVQSVGVDSVGNQVFECRPKEIGKDMDVRVCFDPKVGALVKFEFFSRREYGDAPTRVLEWHNFKEVLPGCFLPEEYIGRSYPFTLDEDGLDVLTGDETTEKMVFKDIIVNQGVSDTEFNI